MAFEASGLLAVAGTPLEEDTAACFTLLLVRTFRASIWKTPRLGLLIVYFPSENKTIYPLIMLPSVNLILFSCVVQASEIETISKIEIGRKEILFTEEPPL